MTTHLDSLTSFLEQEMNAASGDAGKIKDAAARVAGEAFSEVTSEIASEASEATHSKS